MYREILVPFDGSEPAGRALDAALELASDSEHVNITVLQVTGLADLDRSSFSVALRMAGLEPIDDHRFEAVRDNYLSAHGDRMQKQLEGYFEGLPENVDIRIVVRRGSPRDVICRYAEDNGVDCIVMGRRGAHGIRAALGSVSAGVLHDTDLPVLVVK